MAILILNNDESELFLADAYLQLWNAAQGVAAITPDAVLENLKPKAGTLHFDYFPDGRLKSVYYRTVDEESTS